MKPIVTPRSLALEALLAIVRKREPLDAVLPTLYESALNAQDKAFARQLIMSSLRHHGQLWSLLEPNIHTPLEAKHIAIKWLLIMGAAQLYVLKTPPHAAIDTSVTLCKQLGFTHQAGMVNALLRKCDANAPLPPASYNIASWLKGAWRKAYGTDVTDQIAQICTQEPPLDLFTKPGHSIDGETLLPASIRVPVQDITKLPGYDEGSFWVQDLAASLPVRALGDVMGKRVLDMCAAPGGKSLQLCAGGASVMALDRHGGRLKTLQSNLARCHYHADVILADATVFTPQEHFDAVLLDAPCSATGTVRRHPDIWLRKREQEIAEMVQLQRAILDQIMTWLPAEVPLIYAVCSLQTEEGEAQIDWLLDAYPALRLLAIEGIEPTWRDARGCIRTLPHYQAKQGGMDGFFIAKLMRSA